MFAWKIIEADRSGSHGGDEGGQHPHQKTKSDAGQDHLPGVEIPAKQAFPTAQGKRKLKHLDLGSLLAPNLDALIFDIFLDVS